MATVRKDFAMHINSSRTQMQFFFSRGSCGHSDPCRQATEALNHPNAFKYILKHFVDGGET